jgi:hypothetical protein
MTHPTAQEQDAPTAAFDPQTYAGAMDFVWVRKDRSTVRLGDLDKHDLDRLGAWIHGAVHSIQMKRVAACAKGDRVGVEGLGTRLAYLLQAREAVEGVHMYRFWVRLQRTGAAA